MQPNPLPLHMHKEHHVHHPAHGMYLLSFIFLALTVIFGFITVFIPWAMKDIGVQQRAWAYPFKTCVEDTFSKVNQETCLDNDFIEPGGAPITQSSKECKAYILATIAFVFLYVLPGVIALIFLGYVLEHLWWSPLKAAWIANGILLWVCLSTFLAWIMFIIYAEMECVPNSIFPVHGYSYGFVMTVFATGLSIIAVTAAFLGTFKIKKWKKEHEDVLTDFKFEEMASQEPPPMMFPPVLPPSPDLMPPAMSMSMPMSMPYGGSIPYAGWGAGIASASPQPVFPTGS